MYNDVLLATDGSEPASTAMQHALDIAEQYGATLHALFVIDTNTSWLTVSKAEVHDVLYDLGEDASRAVLDDVETAAADADVDLTREVVEGAPDDRIVEYAAANDVDLIVVGTHGRRGIDRRLLGSVTERVIRNAATPVLTVKPRPETDDE